jgi:hypothetical protein
MTTPFDPSDLAVRYPPRSDTRTRRQIVTCPACGLPFQAPGDDNLEYYSIAHQTGSPQAHTLTLRAALWEFPAGTAPVRIWLPWTWA